MLFSVWMKTVASGEGLMEKIKQKINKIFTDFSYNQKIKSLFYIILLITIFIFIVLGFSITNRLKDDAYSRSREKLTLLNYNLQNQLQQVDDIYAELNQNGIIQQDLLDISGKEYFDTADLDKIKSIQTELNWLQVDKSIISSISLYNAKNKKILGDSRDISYGGYQINQELKKIPETETIGKWYFDQNLKEMFYIKNIYNGRDTNFNYVGSLILYINTSFITEILRNSDTFYNDDFFILKNQDKLGTTKSKLITESSGNIENLLGISQGSHFLKEIDGKSYYVYSQNVQFGNTVFQVVYGIENTRIIQDITRIIIAYFCFIVLILLLGFYIVNKYVARLVSPINKLSTEMKIFEQKKDFQILTQNLEINRKDEIGALNKSFKGLVMEIQELIQQEYQSKILNREMEYKFLQAQLDPHFLYNTLNSINWLAIASDNMEISQMVTSLARLLRNKFDSKKDFCSIQEELDIVHAYLNIQKVRFKTRMIYSEQFDTALLQLKIPKLIIQPLIENSIKYGVEKQDKPTEIWLKIIRSVNTLVITVTDNGPGFNYKQTSADTASTKVGLVNIEARIKMLCSEKSTLTIQSTAGIKTEVRIIIPIANYSARSAER